MRFTIFQDTAVGGRSVNQDRMGYCFTRECLLMLVADGMGGHLRGEVAAQLTLQTVGAAFQRDARPRLGDPIAFLDQSLRAAHREILRYQALHGMPEAPRTTVVACVVQDGRAWWAHAGDSRLYWIRDGAVRARTRDHSKVENMVALGLLKPQEQDTHPERNKVLNCLGSPFEPTIEIGPAAELRAGDTLLLCSDGLWSEVHEPELCRRLSGASAVVAVPDLVRSAAAAGGRLADNTTAIAMNWDGDARVDTLAGAALPDGAVTTTIGFGGVEADAEGELSEDEIERTIREIRKAIERSGSR